MTPAGYYTRPPLEERFWSKVDKTGGPDACWLWTAARTSRGYGVFGKVAGDASRAHRVAYELANGVELDKGAVVMHTCDNPPCVNDSHLRLGSHAENMADKVTKGRGALGESVGTSKLTAVQVANIRVFAALGVINARLAEQYGVSQTAIGMIVNRITWAKTPGWVGI